MMPVAEMVTAVGWLLEAMVMAAVETHPSCPSWPRLASGRSCSRS